ncbi:response regulator [Desulfoglaeba alkanexedens]|jgi:DNA-binding NtrC family response regulator|uniref:Response regulator n=1 Tax=Desulfoglaeba alkanexedens ALDC TaxID=980445 RepID=A0A4V1ERG0_9BACT|nr:response regulator [Desulfoglaeba alkanexedens]QCQ21511.1 response regulator [Desulfoglaeba alkanexedens ALDC]
MEKGKGKATGPIRLLLVDDEVGYVDVLKKRMARRGIEVTAAINGTAGIQALRRQPFDVAVLDLKMEDLDGIEVLKIFKKMDPDMPVIMLTGHGSEQSAREGMALGAFDYLTKPCDLAELIEKIEQAVERRR